MNNRPMPFVRLILTATLAGAVPALSGCAGVLRSAGGTALDGAYDRLQVRLTGSGSAQTRQMLDSVTAFAAQSYRKQGAPVIEGTVQTVLHRGESAADSTTARLVAQGSTALQQAKAGLDSTIRGSLNQALQQLVRDNLRLAGREGSADVNQLTAATAASLAVLLPRLDAAATRTAANATNAATTQLAQQLNTTLRDALVNATRGIARTAAKEALDEAHRQGQGGVRAAAVFGIALVVALLLVAAGLFYRQHMRTRTMLDVVTQAIRDSEDQQLKEEIKARATARKIEPVLNDFLQDRGYLATRRVTVPAVFPTVGAEAVTGAGSRGTDARA